MLSNFLLLGWFPLGVQCIPAGNRLSGITKNLRILEFRRTAPAKRFESFVGSSSDLFEQLQSVFTSQILLRKGDFVNCSRCFVLDKTVSKTNEQE